MSNVAKLKKQALEFEQKRQLDKALATYVQLLELFDQHADEIDVALFNRVGDMMLRNGNVADALDYYEKGVDHYSDTGFFNNAIALCNKILRHSPGRASVYYKLGKISAHKGLTNEAKSNFLEYADRMQKAGQMQEAFRALKEFADLSPDQDEIRLMLADQLVRAGRKNEAVEQLQVLHATYQANGRDSDADAIAQRIRTLDPRAEIKSDGPSQAKASSSDLVFLDLDTPSPRATNPTGAAAQAPAAPPAPPAPRPAAPPPPRPAPPPPQPTPVVAQPVVAPPVVAQVSEPIAPPVEEVVEPPPPEAPLGETAFGSNPVSMPPIPEARVGRTPDAPLVVHGSVDLFANDGPLSTDTPASNAMLGLEPTQLGASDILRETPTSTLIDLEPTSFSSAAPPMAAPPAPPPPLDFDTDLVLPAAPPAPPAPRGAPRPAPAPPIAPPPRAPTPLSAMSLSEIVKSDALEFIEPPEKPARSEPVDLHAEALALADEDVAPIAAPPIGRRSTLAIETVGLLEARVAASPDDWSLRRQLAEALFEAGNRESGLQELESAMSGAEHAGDLELASSLAEEIARLEPDSVKHHQKRVEYAFRTNDRGRLIEAYLSLGDALQRADQADKARSIYQRVLDLAPDEIRARTAIETIVVPEPAPPPPPRPSAVRRPTASRPVVPAVPPPPPVPDSLVNLGEWLRDEPPKDTRMVVEEQEPTGDEDADFQDMLRKFKQGVAENVDPEDYQSHYDLAIAFKEMGLLDEAIAEFQKALASTTNRLATFEALGDCFLQKGQPKLASQILTRAMSESTAEEQLVGVLYLLGRAAEEQGRGDEALAFYQRVFVQDIQFRDIGDRMADLERQR